MKIRISKRALLTLGIVLLIGLLVSTGSSPASSAPPAPTPTPAITVTHSAATPAQKAAVAPPQGVSHQCVSVTPSLGGGVAGYRLVMCINLTIYVPFSTDVFIASAEYMCMRGNVYLRCYSLSAQGTQSVSTAQFIPHWVAPHGKLCGLGQVTHCVAGRNTQTNITQITKQAHPGTCYWWQGMTQHIVARVTPSQTVSVAAFRPANGKLQICDH